MGDRETVFLKAAFFACLGAEGRSSWSGGVVGNRAWIQRSTIYIYIQLYKHKTQIEGGVIWYNGVRNCEETKRARGD